jgi:hypothetical protein
MPSQHKEHLDPAQIHLVIEGLEPKALAVVEMLVAAAQAELARGGSLPPLVFLLSGGMEQLTPLPVDIESDLTKRWSMEVISATARKLNASHSIMLVEAWGVENTGRGVPPGRISEMAERVDSLFISIESPEKQWTCWAPLEPTKNKKGRKTKGPLKFEVAHILSGQLCGVFTPSNDAVLH